MVDFVTLARLFFNEILKIFVVINHNTWCVELIISMSDKY